MQLFIFFSVALVALSSANQLKNGPQILSEKLSSSESQKIYKRSMTQEFNSYFTPEEVQALQAVKSSQDLASIETLKRNSGISEESYNELVQKFYAENLKPAPIEEPQVEPDRSSSNFFLPREEFVYNNKPNYRQLLMDQTKLSGHAQKNKFSQLARPSVTGSAFFEPASNSDRKEDQRKSEKEIEYILRNVQTDQPRQIISLNQARTQNSGRNVDQKKSAFEGDIENAWKQYQAFEFERANSPAEKGKQSHSTSYENQEMTEEQKQIEYILRNGQVYGLERTNANTEITNEDSQGRNEGQNEYKGGKEIEDFWRKQQDSPFQRSFFSDGVLNQGPSGWNKNQDNLEEKQSSEFILGNRQTEFGRENAPEVHQSTNQSPLGANTDQNKSDEEKLQNILKKHQDFAFQRSKAVAEAINQSPPIKIHEHVLITKHVPIPVLKTVQVAVPTPVLVPIPQPYEVKVPHLYPVPLQVVKHVPVPVLRHY